MSTLRNSDYVSICTHAMCGNVSTSNDQGKLLATASHHAWAHHHQVELYRRDLSQIGTVDHEGKTLQQSLF